MARNRNVGSHSVALKGLSKLQQQRKLEKMLENDHIHLDRVIKKIEDDAKRQQDAITAIKKYDADQKEFEKRIKEIEAARKKQEADLEYATRLSYEINNLTNELNKVEAELEEEDGDAKAHHP